MNPSSQHASARCYPPSDILFFLNTMLIEYSFRVFDKLSICMKKASDIIILMILYLFSRFKLTSAMFIVFGIYSSYFRLAALCSRGKCCLNCIRNIKYKMQVLHTFVFRNCWHLLYFCGLQRCQDSSARDVRSDRNGSGLQLGLQSPLVPQPLPGLTYLHRSPRPVQTQIVPPATNLGWRHTPFRSLTKL